MALICLYLGFTLFDEKVLVSLLDSWSFLHVLTVTAQKQECKSVHFSIIKRDNVVHDLKWFK